MDFQQFKKGQPKRNLKLRIAFSKHLESEPVFELLNAVESETGRRLKELILQKQEEEAKHESDSIAIPILESYFEDEVSLAEAATEIASHFSIVALYSRIEIRTKQMCVIALPGIVPQDLFLWKKLKKQLRTNGIDVEKMVNYREVNQLRCLNNSIKHSGIVDGELAATGWGKEGTEINANKCRQSLPELANAGEAYLGDLASKLSFVIDGLTDEQAERQLSTK